VSSGSTVSLTFNSELPDDPAGLKLYTNQKGLTATTEQILLHSGSQNFDFFCWYKSPPAKSEISDFQKIRPAVFWEDENIESCFESSMVKNGQTLKKISDEENSSAWEIFNPDPAGSSASASGSGNSSSKNKSSSAGQGNLSDLVSGQNSLMENSPVRITEIYPLTKNKQENEWVEIRNVSTQPVNLTGWIIDDADGGSKPKRLTATDLSTATLPPGQVTLLDFKKLKITLNNDTDSIRLFLPDGQPAGQQDYQEGKKGQSFSMITLDGEENWIWTDSPTPGVINPELQTLTGIIEKAPEFKSTYYFVVSVDQANPANNSDDTVDAGKTSDKLLVTFDESVIKGPQARDLFTPGTKASLSGEITAAPENPNNYGQMMKLYNYEIIEQSENNSLSPALLIIAIISALVLIIYLIPKIFPQWKLLISDKSS
jgi:hypothetical protein